jgi:hypothetical protein
MKRALFLCGGLLTTLLLLSGCSDARKTAQYRGNELHPSVKVVPQNTGFSDDEARKRGDKINKPKK